FVRGGNLWLLRERCRVRSQALVCGLSLCFPLFRRGIYSPFGFSPFSSFHPPSPPPPPPPFSLPYFLLFLSKTDELGCLLEVPPPPLFLYTENQPKYARFSTQLAFLRPSHGRALQAGVFPPFLCISNPSFPLFLSQRTKVWL